MTTSQPANEASRDEMDGLQLPRDKLLQRRATAAEEQTGPEARQLILAVRVEPPISCMEVKTAEWHEASGGQGG